MRMQRIYFRDTGHGRYERGSYRSTGTYQVSVLIGLPHQFLCNDIHNRVTVGNDGITVQPLLYNGRQFFPVHLVRLVITDITQHLI